MTTVATLPTPGGMAVPVPTGALPGLDLLEQWVTAAERAHALVAPLVKTAFVPDSFWPQPAGMDRKAWPNPKLKPDRESPEDYAARCEIAAAGGTSAVLLGMGVGVDPWTALANIHVVKSRPGMSSKLKVSLAKAAGHRIEEVERTPEAVTVEGQRKGSATVVSIRITIEEARTAGWTSNDTYQKTPADMLYARAASRVVDRVCPEVTFGLASIEELETADEPAAAPEPTRVTVEDLAARAAAPRAVAAAAPTPEPEPAAGEQPVAMIEKPTWDAINREWKRLGVVGDGLIARRLAGIRRLTGREQLAGGAELTASQADVVLDTLRSIAADDAARIADVLGEDRPGDSAHVDMADADALHGPADDVPEPDDAERAAAAAPVAGDEPAGWQQ